MQKKITTKKIDRTKTNESVFDREFWKQAGHEARFSAAWLMIDEMFLMRGKDRVSQSRLQRSVSNIKRRKG